MVSPVTVWVPVEPDASAVEVGGFKMKFTPTPAPTLSKPITAAPVFHPRFGSIGVS